MTEEMTEKRRAAAALKSYDEKTGEFRLPKVTAAGYGEIAERILEMAAASGVEVREDAALAEMLVKFGVESEIPSEALVAVAEILAYVYKLNGKLK
ncbi:MAG: flagellar protein FhlB [Micavibrio sp.]|nr:MAG: flagellar protein FhlB [Micavibrio sp.]